MKMAGVADTFAIVGFSILDSAQEPNSGFMFIRLKPFASRTTAQTQVTAMIGQVFGMGAQIRSANVLAFNLPPIIGLGTAGGFEYQLDALEGQDPSELNSTLNGLLTAARADHRLGQVFSTFTASNPSLFLDIDREKAQALGLNMSDVFAALQATLGGIYINDFNLYGRVWQVNIQGEAFDRSDIPALWQIYIRNKTNQMVPLRSIADVRIMLGPQIINRYNNYRSVTINGSPAPGVSSGQSIAAMAASRRTRCRRLRLRMDRHGVSGGGGGRADRHHPGAGRAVRLPVPGRRSTKAGSSRSPCCCRSPWACSAR